MKTKMNSDVILSELLDDLKGQLALDKPVLDNWGRGYYCAINQIYRFLYEKQFDDSIKKCPAEQIIDKTSALELERVFLQKNLSSLVSFIEGARYIEKKMGVV